LRLYAFWLGYAAPFIIALLAYYTHVKACIHHEYTFLLLASIPLIPVGVLHGWGIWLGIFAS
jgi:hypothetical protein